MHRTSQRCDVVKSYTIKSALRARQMQRPLRTALRLAVFSNSELKAGLMSLALPSTHRFYPFPFNGCSLLWRGEGAKDLQSRSDLAGGSWSSCTSCRRDTRSWPILRFRGGSTPCSPNLPRRALPVLQQILKGFEPVTSSQNTAEEPGIDGAQPFGRLHSESGRGIERRKLT